MTIRKWFLLLAGWVVAAMLSACGGGSSGGLQPPATPIQLSAVAADSQVTVAWDAVPGATSYNLYWSDTSPVTTSSNKVTGAVAPFVHTGLTNGKIYYYAVTAVNSAGESALSGEVGATPNIPSPGSATVPPSPAGLTAIAARDTPAITVQWFDVTYPTAVQYNLYRGTQAGLATYFQDATRAVKFANVTAPYLDTAVSSKTTYYYVVTAVDPASGNESAPSGEIAVTTARAGGGGGGGAGGGGGESAYGSNLSFPLVYADGYGTTGLPIIGTWPGVGPFTPMPAIDYSTGLRPLTTETPPSLPYYDPSTAVSIGGTTYYPQATASTWQAEWRSNTTGATENVVVDWGDSLLSKTYTSSSLVRIETVLKQDATTGVTDTMKGYTMALISGTGINELQGTSGQTYDSSTRNVFAINAHLKIEKLNTDGSVDAVVYDHAVAQNFGTSTEGGGSSGGSGGSVAVSPFSSEINQGGSLVYGMNFRVSNVSGVASKTGQYRITFSLDPNVVVNGVTVPNHVLMVNKADAGATLSPDGLSSSVIITVN
ncbi:MAG: hypothetical protein KGL68_03455 [Burkholderiales bacterium]|nr:hypothetical protein [Burkholderiales bacterium]